MTLYSTPPIIFKSLCLSQRLLVLQRILFSSYYYYCYYHSSRQNLVRTYPRTLFKIRCCHLAHILI